MDLSLEAVACLDSQQLRVLLPQWLTGFLEVSDELKQRSTAAVQRLSGGRSGWRWEPKLITEDRVILRPKTITEYTI